MSWFQWKRSPIVKCSYCRATIRRSTARRTEYGLMCDEVCAHEFHMAMAW